MRFLYPCLCCETPSEQLLCPICREGFDKARVASEPSVLFADGASALFDYGDRRVRRVLFLLKGRGLRAAVRLFVPDLVAAAERSGRTFCAVSFISRRASMRRKTGVDQAELLARAVARRMGLACVPLLVRRGRSRAQHNLPREQRFENVRGKFVAAKNLPRGAILLIDDIITTGATASEACRVLRVAGAEEIYVLAVARGGAL